MAFDAQAADTVGMLLERESSLASLAECARDARRGEGRLVLVAGEAGIGKSALVEQLANDMTDARWSWGACDGLFTPRPLGPLFDLAGHLGGELLDLCRARATREELFGALLRQVDEPGMLNVVVVEDVHWADEATVDLLRFLGRRIRSIAVLLIVTYRDDALTASDPLLLALGELATQRSTRRIDLARLSVDAVGILAGGSGLDAAALHHLTDGNPFYVTELAQVGMSAVPASARDAVLARAARLTGGARHVLDIAALIGTRIELRLLESVTARSASAGSSSAPLSSMRWPSVGDELLASGLIVGDGTWLRFRHEIARLAIEQQIAAHRGVVIHAQILDTLSTLGCDDDARMAFHAEGAGNGPAVLRYAPAAARRAAEMVSHREAAIQYERALRFAADAVPTMVAGLYDGFAREVSLVDRWQDAADAGERALALWRTAGDRLRVSDTLRWLSRAMWNLCRGAESADASEAAVAILEPSGLSTELAWAYANLASQRMADAEYPGAIELARRAQVIAVGIGVSEVLSDALNTEACAVARTGGDWIALLRRALDIAISGGHVEQVGRAYTNLHGICCDQRRFVEAEQYLVDGIAYSDEHDIGTYAMFLRSGWTWALGQTGRWDEAVSLSSELLSRSASSSINRIWPLATLGMIRARRSEPGAWECLDEAMTATDGTGEPQYVVPVRLARAEAFWLQGQQRLAEREVEFADDVAAVSDTWQRGAIAAWLRRTGSTRPSRGNLTPPYRWEIAGDPERAADVWTGLGCPYDAALALLDTTREVTLRRALGIFQNLGASAAIGITRRKMRLLGIRSIPAGPRTATRAHPLGLTRREHEVLDLICDGRTNAEIAAKLFIAAKTVDHHVSAVLAKLDVPNRAAASEAARRGPVGESGAPVRHGRTNVALPAESEVFDGLNQKVETARAGDPMSKTWEGHRER